MDEDIVYRIVRVAFENKRRIEKAHAALRQMSLAAMSGPIAGLTFHPGALRFFKEAGLR